jgi:hypothetical protein
MCILFNCFALCFVAKVRTSIENRKLWGAGETLYRIFRNSDKRYIIALFPIPSANASCILSAKFGLCNK